MSDSFTVEKVPLQQDFYETAKLFYNQNKDEISKLGSRDFGHWIGILAQIGFYFAYNPFSDFFKAMIETMNENQAIKGNSWMDQSWAYLTDMLLKQFDDQNVDPDREDYMVNVSNYAAMIWTNEKAGRI